MFFLAFVLSFDLNAFSQGQLMASLLVFFVLMAIVLWYLVPTMLRSFRDLPKDTMQSLFTDLKNRVGPGQTEESFVAARQSELEPELNQLPTEPYTSLRELMTRIGICYSLRFGARTPYGSSSRIKIYNKKKTSSFGKGLLYLFIYGTALNDRLFHYVTCRFLDHRLELRDNGDSVQIFMDSKKVGTIDLISKKLFGEGVKWDFEFPNLHGIGLLSPKAVISENNQLIAELSVKPSFKERWINRFKFFTGQEHGLGLFQSLPQNQDHDVLLFAFGIFCLTSIHIYRNSSVQSVARL
jgi:hypothetical protein